MPSVTRLPRTENRGTNLTGSWEATSETASGSQMRIESVISRGRDKEVERHAEDPHQHRAGVVAHESGLHPAHSGRTRAHETDGAPGPPPADQAALQHRPGEAAEPLGRAHDRHVDQLVEVPLVEQELV